MSEACLMEMLRNLKHELKHNWETWYVQQLRMWLGSLYFPLDPNLLLKLTIYWLLYAEHISNYALRLT